MTSHAPLVRAPDPRAHVSQLVELSAQTFGGYFPMRDHCRQGYLLHSHYDWHASRVALVDGHVVSHWGVWDFQMRIGHAHVRTAGIGLVMTHADHRKRGHMARVAPASIRAMRDAGYHLSILFGIGDFYHRFGYVCAWSDTTHHVDTNDLPSGRPTAPLRRFALASRTDVDALYNRHHAGLTGTAVRPTYARNSRGKDWLAFRWTGSRDRTLGYVVVSPRKDHLVCREACGKVDDVLCALAAIARRRQLPEVRFPTLHPASALARHIRRGNCRVETFHRRCGGAMVRTVNLAETLRSIAPELERRLADSPCAAWRGNLLVADRRQEVMLVINRSRVRLAPPRPSRHALRGGDRIAQLLIGTHEPDETLEADRARCTGDARNLARALFPVQHPMLEHWDRI